MKPLKLELQAFGPYVEKQTVDFEKLSQSGIFLIKGKTGSGKTTIFDAMTFALYGGGSGENDKIRTGRNDFEEWRCTRADGNTETFVSFTFSVREHVYRFTRRLIPKRVRTLAVLEAGELDENGTVIPFFENPKKEDLNRKAEELIGLTKEQFRQVVLLPQGQFERFLTASSSEKEEILQKIFGAEQWERYAQCFFEEASERKKRYDDLRDTIALSLREEGLSDLPALDERLTALSSEREKLQKDHIAFDGEKKRRALDADRQLSDRFRSLHNKEKEYDALCARKQTVRETCVRYEEAEKAEKLRRLIEDSEKAETEFSARRKTRERLFSGLEAAKNAEAEAKKAQKAHEASSPVKALTETVGEYEGKRAGYRTLGALEQAYKTAEAERKRAEGEAYSAKRTLESAVKKAADAKSAFDRAADCAKDYRDRYYRGIYGEIAGALADGEKCPVCGSTVHPEPAPRLPDSVGKEAVDEKEAAADAARETWDRAEKARVQADEALKAASDTLAERMQTSGAARAALDAAKKNRIEGIDDEKALEKKISGLRAEIEDDRKCAETLAEAYRNALKSLTEQTEKLVSAESEESAAREKAEEAAGKLHAKLAENGYADRERVKALLTGSAERTRMHEEIVRYETTLKQAEEELSVIRSELAGMTEPDASLFDGRNEEIAQENDRYIKEDTRLTENTERLSEKREKLTSMEEAYRAGFAQAESDLLFARKLRGDSGIGLQRYILAVLFGQVIGEANRMLEKVHGGRYHLKRTDEKGNGNKRGLELNAYDAWSPENEGRSVATLSGGEKFLVSLALSIGMSTVARKTGVQIEALFIDEGFGTLDENSIRDALDVLDSVRSGSGMIGIISHVELLEANIPTHLEVVSGEGGSAIRVR